MKEVYFYYLIPIQFTITLKEKKQIKELKCPLKTNNNSSLVVYLY